MRFIGGLIGLSVFLAFLNLAVAQEQPKPPVGVPLTREVTLSESERLQSTIDMLTQERATRERELADLRAGVQKLNQRLDQYDQALKACQNPPKK